MTRCGSCGRELAPASRGRPPRYCSRACRARAYRARVAQRQVPEIVAGDDGGLDLGRIVLAGIAVADRDGLDRMSMRRTAAELGAGVMSLYRYVPSREALTELMVDRVVADYPLPEPGPDGWRAKLELSARTEWSIYHDHPWLAALLATTSRPVLAPNLMRYADWRMRAVDGCGLDFTTMARVALAITTHLNGAASALAHETVAARHSTRQQWFDRRADSIRATLASGWFPMVSRFGPAEFLASQPEAVFEFGLTTVLDGIAALIGEPGPAARA